MRSKLIWVGSDLHEHYLGNGGSGRSGTLADLDPPFIGITQTWRTRDFGDLTGGGWQWAAAGQGRSQAGQKHFFGAFSTRGLYKMNRFKAAI